MKFALLLAVSTVLVAFVVSARPPRPPRPTGHPLFKFCNKARDCDADECCLSGAIFKKGVCQKLGTEGDKCDGDNHRRKGRYLFRCPCAEGFTCEAEDVKDTIYGMLKVNEKCVVSTGTPGNVTTPAEEPTEGSNSSESSSSEEI